MQPITINHSTVIQEIKERIDIADLVRDHVELKQKGNRYWGLCPFHVERTPSFSVNPEKQAFYCFGCGESGDIFTFITKYHKTDFKAARDLLAARAGIKVSTQTPEDRQRIEAARNRRAQEKELAAKLEKAIDIEIRLLIAAEKWCYMIDAMAKNEKMLEIPAVIWAIKSKDRISALLDDLMQASAPEKIEILGASRGVLQWNI